MEKWIKIDETDLADIETALYNAELGPEAYLLREAWNAGHNVSDHRVVADTDTNETLRIQELPVRQPSGGLRETRRTRH